MQIKSPAIPSIGDTIEQWEFLYPAGGIVNWFLKIPFRRLKLGITH